MFAPLLLLPLALAGEPDVTVDDDGRVVGRITVPASEARVREVVDDPVQCGLLSPEVVSVASEDASDGCLQVVTQTRGLWRPLEMRSRRCPTPTGWQDELVHSDDFTAYDSTWAIEQTEQGTEVTVGVRTRVDLPVPDRMLEKRSRKTVGQMLRNLLDKVDR